MKLNFLYKLLILTFYSLAAISMSACAGIFGSDGESWKEEVKLSDGRVIVIERETIREAGGDEWASNRGGTKPKEYKLWFADPDGSGKMIEWRSAKVSPKTWPEVPLVFDLISNKPTVFSLVAISVGCEVYSKYVYKNNEWIEESLPESFDSHETNLLFGSKRDIPALVTLGEKRNRNDGAGYGRELKQVGPVRKVCG